MNYVCIHHGKSILSDYRMPINVNMWLKHDVILGHNVSKNGISVYEGKVNLILELPSPTNFKGAQGQYHKSILFYAKIGFPLHTFFCIISTYIPR